MDGPSYLTRTHARTHKRTNARTRALNRTRENAKQVSRVGKRPISGLSNKYQFLESTLADHSSQNPVCFLSP